VFLITIAMSNIPARITVLLRKQGYPHGELTTPLQICSNRSVARWLLPLLAVLALCGRSVTAFAAAGWVGKVSCCCPNPEVCKCHHDGKPRPDAELKRCNGGGTLIAPEDAGVTVPALTVPAVTQVRATFVAFELTTLVSMLPVPPEPPPI
jgi:hypothetical protein